jgi:signal transduction histidine kinase
MREHLRLAQDELSVLDEQRLRRLIEVGRAIVSELDLEVVLERVLDVARELTGASYAALGVLDERREALERFITRGIDADARRAIGDLPRGRGVLGVLISDPRPLRLNDVGEHARSYGFPPGHPPMRSFLGVPVMIRGEAYGNLYLTEKEGGFDDADEAAIVVLADWAAIAVDNARIYEREHDRRAALERAVAGLEATMTVARAVGGETDLDRVLELIAKRARALVEARGMTIMLHDGDDLVLAAVAGTLDRAIVGTRIPVEGSVSGAVLETRSSERLHDAAARLRFGLGELVDADSGLLVPLVYRGEALGVLAAFDRLSNGPGFDAEDERLLESLAASAATAVATAQGAAAQALERSIEAAERERQHWARELHDETLQELAGLKLMLGGALANTDPEAIRRTLELAMERIDLEIQGLRHLITDLRPAALDEMGVAAALEALVERTAAATGIDIELRCDLACENGRSGARLVEAVETTVYRVVQEALTNVVKHAGASNATIDLAEDGGKVTLTVTDDGAGFTPARSRAGFGLTGMRERVALVHGTIYVSTERGSGTTITATIPAEHRSEDGAASAHQAGTRRA